MKIIKILCVLTLVLCCVGCSSTTEPTDISPSSTETPTSQITETPSVSPVTSISAKDVTVELEYDENGNITTSAKDLFYLCYDQLNLNGYTGDIHINGLPGTDGISLDQGEYSIIWNTDDNLSCEQKLTLVYNFVPTQIITEEPTPTEEIIEVTEEPEPTEEIIEITDVVTEIPTEVPTETPIETPTPTEKIEPTVKPTPTEEPTKIVTETPTTKPEPTEEVTPEVTEEVTPEVTEKPTEEPTKAPKNDNDKAKLSQSKITVKVGTSEDELIGMLQSIYVSGTDQYTMVDQNSLYDCLDALVAGQTGKYVVNYVAVDNSFVLPLTVVIEE